MLSNLRESDLGFLSRVMTDLVLRAPRSTQITSFFLFKSLDFVKLIIDLVPSFYNIVLDLWEVVFGLLDEIQVGVESLQIGNTMSKFILIVWSLMSILSLVTAKVYIIAVFSYYIPQM